MSVREVSGALLVSDVAGLSHAVLGTRCVSVDRHTMRCPLRRFETQIGNGDDVAGPMNTKVRAELDGQEGDDTFQAGSPSFLTNVEFVGGSDDDTATYLASAAVGWCTDRRRRPAQRQPARPGHRNIGRDVERIIIAALADEITAHSPGDLEGTASFLDVRGGQGNEVLRGGAGERVTFAMGPVADGADKIVGAHEVLFGGLSARRASPPA